MGGGERHTNILEGKPKRKTLGA